MTLPHAALGVLLGLALGAGARWLTWEDVLYAMPVTGPPEEARHESQSSGEDQKAPPSTRVTLEEVCQAQGDAFLSKLVAAISTARPADLEALLTALEAQHRPDGVDVLAKDLIFLRWMERDPASGLRAGRQHDLLSVAYWAWGKVDADAALAGARGESDNRLIAKVVPAIGQSDPERALALIREVPVQELGAVLDGIIEAVSNKDPQRGVEMAQRLNQSYEVRRERIKHWVRIDPETALPWIHDHFPTAGELCEPLFHSHLDRVPELLANLPEGWSKTGLEIEYASRLSETKGPEAALALFREKSPSVQDHASGVIALRLARSDPESAIEILRQIAWENPPLAVAPDPDGIVVIHPEGRSGQNGGPSHEPVQAIAALIKVDPLRTVEFLETLPDTMRVRNAYGAVTISWMRQDSMEASRWVAQLSAGPLKDAAIRSMSWGLISGSHPDFEAAAHWSLEASNSEVVEDALSEVFARWQRIDPEGFMSGLEIPGLPASIVDRFHSNAPNGP